MQSTGPTTPLTASECRQMQGVCQSKKIGADSTEKLSQCGILQVFRDGCRKEFSLLPRFQRLHRLNCRQTCPRFMQGRTTNAKSAHHPHPQLANGHSQRSLGQRPGRTPAENHGLPLPQQRSGITNIACSWVTTRAEAHATTTKHQLGEDAQVPLC